MAKNTEIDEKISLEKQLQQDVREGEFLADYKKVETLCQNALDAINELPELGYVFIEPDGRLTRRYFGAHTYRRTYFYGDEIGKEIIRILIEHDLD